MEELKVKFPGAKISVRKATVKAGSGVAYIATIKNAQGSALRDLPKDHDSVVRCKRQRNPEFGNLSKV